MLGVGASGPLAEDREPETIRTGGASAEAERDAWAILAGVDGLGPVGFAALLERFGSRPSRSCGSRPVRAGSTSSPPTPHGSTADESSTSPTDLVDPGVRHRRRGRTGRPHALQDPRAGPVGRDGGGCRRYPSRLAAIELPPHLLFVLGDVRALAARPCGRRRRHASAVRARAGRWRHASPAALVAPGDRRLRSGRRDRRSGPRCDGRQRWIDGRGDRRWPRHAVPSGAPGAGRRDRRRGRCRRVRARARHRVRRRARSRAGTASSVACRTRPSWSRRRPGAVH